MKKLLTSIGLTFALAISLQAASLVYSTNVLTTNFANYLLSGPLSVDSITLVTTNTGTVVRFYDNNTTSGFYTNNAYTNMVSYMSNLVSEVVDTFGVTNSYTNLVLFVQRNANAASTNALDPRAAFVLHTSFATTGSDLGYFAKGLVMSNDIRGVNVIVYYRRP